LGAWKEGCGPVFDSEAEKGEKKTAEGSVEGGATSETFREARVKGLVGWLNGRLNLSI